VQNEGVGGLVRGAVLFLFLLRLRSGLFNVVVVTVASAIFVTVATMRQQINRLPINPEV
jgi:hypothetical protein